MKGINIGTTVYDKINQITEFNGAVYPIVAPNDTRFPFCVFTRVSVTPSYTKDGCAWVDVVENVIVAAQTYHKSVELAEKVCDAMNFSNFEMCSLLDSCSEEWNDETYIQNLTFRINIRG